MRRRRSGKGVEGYRPPVSVIQRIKHEAEEVEEDGGGGREGEEEREKGRGLGG